MAQQLPEKSIEPPHDDSAYVQSVDDWRFEDEKKLAAPQGWLALTAHVWLDRGKQTIGTSSSDTIRLPSELGESTRAVLVVDGDQVRLLSEEDSGFRVNGTWKHETELQIDSSKLEADSGDKITIGDRITIQLVRRNGKLAMRVRDAQSDAIARFAGKRWFPVDPKYCVEAEYQAYETPKPIRIINIRGDETTMEIVGYAEFELDGQRMRLDAMLDSPTELFFVFKDPTSGKSTYGPGRFLNAEVPSEGTSVKLDFNKAHNPPCAFSPHTLCPLPPKQNQLAIEIPAGEMSPRGK